MLGAALLYLGLVFAGPESVQPFLIITGPAGSETQQFHDALETLIRREWDTLGPKVRGYTLEAGSLIEANGRAVYTARLTVRGGKPVEFPRIPIRKTTPKKAARDVWRNVRRAFSLQAKQYSRDG